jgi:chaperonin cofactor prefoldin
MNLNETTLATAEEDPEADMTVGEALIFAKLEQLEDQLNELVEKVNNLNLSDANELTIERY